MLTKNIWLDLTPDSFAVPPPGFGMEPEGMKNGNTAQPAMPTVPGLPQGQVFSMGIGRGRGVAMPPGMLLLLDRNLEVEQVF